MCVLIILCAGTCMVFVCQLCHWPPLYVCDSMQMEAEAKIPASAKFWCPKKECSNLLIVKKSTHLEVECTACRAYLCTGCRSFGHGGMTCAEAEASCRDQLWNSLGHSLFSNSADLHSLKTDALAQTHGYNLLQTRCHHTRPASFSSLMLTLPIWQMAKSAGSTACHQVVTCTFWLQLWVETVLTGRLGAHCIIASVNENYLRLLLTELNNVLATMQSVTDKAHFLCRPARWMTLMLYLWHRRKAGGAARLAGICNSCAGICTRRGAVQAIKHAMLGVNDCIYFCVA